jgi:uncharacterized membrane protein
MIKKASITVHRRRVDVEREWQASEYRIDDAAVTFADAPGDRGTEIHVQIDANPPAGKLGETVQKLAGNEPLAKAKDDLRRFKQVVETGVIARSDATPEGEALERKLRQRPAQPVEA